MLQNSKEGIHYVPKPSPRSILEHLTIKHSIIEQRYIELAYILLKGTATKRHLRTSNHMPINSVNTYDLIAKLVRGPRPDPFLVLEHGLRRGPAPVEHLAAKHVHA